MCDVCCVCVYGREREQIETTTDNRGTRRTNLGNLLDKFPTLSFEFGT